MRANAGDNPSGMFGTLRLILAACVVASHYELAAGGLSNAAVIGFYIISGYTMAGLMTHRFADTRYRIGHFYLDRLLRLAPQYYFWMLLTIILAFGCRIGFGDALSARPTIGLFLANILIVPNNFYMFFGTLPHFMLVPTSWSLGVEILFYAFLPLLIRSPRIIWWSTGASLIVSFLAASGTINEEVFGFRLLPGVLVFFMLGQAIYRRDKSLTTFILLGLSAGGVASYCSGQMAQTMALPLMFGWILGAPLVFGLSYLQPNYWDTRLGNASYGCYLCQWLLTPLVRMHLHDAGWSCLLMAGAMAMGLAGYYVVDRPITLLRRTLVRRVQTRA